MRERRKFNRLKSQDKTTFEEENKPKDGALLDISPGGMRILVDSDIKIGSAISGKFKIIPNGGPFYVQGEVIWVTPVTEKIKPPSFVAGIRFSKISAVPF